jgi:hypothetical protein
VIVLNSYGERKGAHAFTLVVRKVNRTRYVKVCKIRGLPKATYEVLLLLISHKSVRIGELNTKMADL